MKKLPGIMLFAVLAACGGGSGPPAVMPPIQDPPPTLALDEVQTAEGVYKGSVEGNLLVFRGVRYAAPPVGNLRFKARERYSFGVSDWRGWFGSQGS